MKLIELRQVYKTFHKGFKQSLIIKNIDFTVEKGEFVVLKGENGAGKTTLLNLILGLLKPSKGEVKLMGCSPQDSAAKTLVGVVLQNTEVPKDLKVKELVQLVQSYYPNSNSIPDVLKTVSLEDKAEARASDLSGGQKQRLYFALALVGNPELLILDEPTRNLDDKGYEEFWKQIRLCRERGITILMVTNNKSDWDELKQLTTRYVTLHKLTEMQSTNQLSQNINTINNEESSTNTKNKEIAKNTRFIPSPNFSHMFINQLWVEVIQLLRTPMFLIGIFLEIIVFANFVNILPFNDDVAKKVLIFLSIFILLTIALVKLGERVVIERAEGWLKLLRVTPLPPIIYISAKISTTLIVCSISIALFMILRVWRIGIQTNPEQFLLLFFSLVLGVIPFAVLSLMLSYLIKPKSFNSIIGLLIVIGLGTYGALPLIHLRFLQNIIAFSPFYHYIELTLWAANVDNNQHILLHLLWLVWAGGVFGLMAIWAYQRESVTQ